MYSVVEIKVHLLKHLLYLTTRWTTFSPSASLCFRGMSFLLIYLSDSYHKKGNIWKLLHYNAFPKIKPALKFFRVN